MSTIRAFFRTAFSERYRLKTVVIIFGILFIMMLFNAQQNQTPQNQNDNNVSNKIKNSTTNTPKYSDKQIRAAKDSWRIITRDLRDVGLIRDIKETNSKTIIYVEGIAWRTLPYEKKKELYSNILKTKKILEGDYHPKIDILDYRSGKAYAEQGVFSSDVYE